MNNLLCPIQWVVAAILLLTAALCGVLVLPLGNDARLVSEYLRTIRQAERLREDEALLSRSLAIRAEIRAGLIDGSLSLREAATALRTEYENRPAHLRPDLGMTEEDSLRLFLLEMEWDLSDDPRRSDVLKRLRAAFQVYQDCFASTGDASGCQPTVVPR